MKTLRLLIALLVSLSSLMSLRIEAEEQTPYSGSPFSLPGYVTASQFDNGGEGVAYHDADVGNRGSGRRQTDVDIDAYGYLSLSTYVGWTEAGEWLEYTVDVTASGRYMFEVTVGSDGVGGTFHIEFDGVDKTGPIAVPDTGGWRNFIDVGNNDVQLAQGQQVMRIVMDSIGPSGSVANIVGVNIRSASVIPGQIQSELYDAGGEGVAYHDSDVGNNGGSGSDNVDTDYDSNTDATYVGWTQAGEWIRYTVNVQTAGYYRMDATIASEGDGGTFHIEFGGVDKTGPIAVQNTGGWRVWQTVRAPRIYLDAGLHEMRLVMDSNGPSGSVANFDRLQFTQLGTIPGHIEAEAFNDGGEGVGYHDTDVGNNGGFYRATDVDIDFDSSPDRNAYYVGWTEAGEWLAYTVDVVSEGYYRFEAQVASRRRGGVFHIELNGVDITGPVTVPDTGDWRNWIGVSKNNIYLTPTTNAILRIVLDSTGFSGSVGNIDFISFGRQEGPTP